LNILSQLHFIKISNLNESKVSVLEDLEDDDGTRAAVTDVQELAVRVDLDFSRVLQTNSIKVFYKSILNSSLSNNLLHNWKQI